MEEEVNLELLPMEEDIPSIKDEWSAYQVTKPNEKSTVKRVDDGTKVQKRSNKVKPGKQPKVPDEKLTEKARDHFFLVLGSFNTRNFQFFGRFFFYFKPFFLCRPL